MAALTELQKAMIINFLRSLCVIFFAATIGGTAFADSGETALHRLAAKGYIKSVKHFIDGGADVNAEDKYGRTPLHFAARFGQTETALALVKAGADVNAKNTNGWTPLHFAAYYGQAENRQPKKSLWERFLIEVGLVKKDEVKDDIVAILVRTGADINAKTNKGNTPLHLAAHEGKAGTAVSLVKARADLFIRRNGETARKIAEDKHGYSSAIAIFLSGAEDKQRKEEWEKRKRQQEKDQQKADELLRELE